MGHTRMIERVRHVYTPHAGNMHCGVTLHGETCGRHRGDRAHAIVCDSCHRPIDPDRLSTSSAIDGFHHGTCLSRLVTPRQEADAIDVGLNGVGDLLDEPPG